eukprot:TRINITY_DN70015_c0_g1_i1.p1 TRINITY_DN70015_c0_g1~~TRINITY_DN70015_c0_g1_i1.p1  ORF type:complete len:1518 (+),score=490.52 TRINITY_DN70015_c0_g1_i1:107-4660(+)
MSAIEVDCSDDAVAKQLRVLDSTSCSPQERVRALDVLAAVGKARTAPLADPVPLVLCLRRLMVSKGQYTRCAALRVLRHFVHDVGFQRCCWERRIDWFVARSMDRATERDKKLERERDLAFKLAARLTQLRLQEHRHDVEVREGRPQPRPETPAAAAQGAVGLSQSVTGGRMGSPVPAPQLAQSAPGAGMLPQSPAGAEGAEPSALQPLAPSERQPLLPQGVVTRLASAAENPEDPYQRRAVVLLRDLLTASPRTVADANAVRTLVAAAADPEMQELHQSIVQALLYVVDTAESRRYIRLTLDLQPLFAPFTEKIGKETAELRKRLRCAKDIVLFCLRSWVGLFALASDPRGLRPLIDTLRLPGKTWRKMTIFEIFHTALRTAASHRGVPAGGPWADYADEAGGAKREGDAAAGDAVAADDDSKHQQDHAGDAAGATDDARRQRAASICAGYNALDIFLGALLLVLDHCGLTETLVSLIRLGMCGGSCPDGTSDTDAALVSQAAAHLLQTMLLLGDTLFPRFATLKIYNSFDSAIASLLASPNGPASRELTTTSKVLSVSTGLFHKAAYASVARKEVRLDSIKLQMSSNMEDNQFRILLSDSQVTATKDWNRWNCETVLFLIKGPLRLPSRLQEVLKTKFFKRLLSFLKPRKRLFSDMPYKEDNLVYSTVACGLIELLLQSKEGVKYLSESGLLEELRVILNEVPSTQVPEKEKVLCKDRIMYYMAREYFKIIGKFSESAVGVELLTQHQIYRSLQALMEKSRGPDRDRDDICHQILKHLNFGRVGHQPVNHEARAIFAKAITEGSKPIRLFATLQLRNSLRLGSKESVDWALDLLVAQLADSWREVAKGAYEIIDEWCALDDEVLEQFIDKRPGLQTFTRREEGEDHAQRLLLRMLTRPSGFAYLLELGVVPRQLQEWRQGKAVEWALGVERSLAKAVTPPPRRGDEPGRQRRRGQRGDAVAAGAAAVLPPHLYGELCQTPQGCRYLRESGVWDELLATIRHALAPAAASEAQAQGWPTPQAPEPGSEGMELRLGDGDSDDADCSRPVGLGTAMRGSVLHYFQQDEGDIGDIGDSASPGPPTRQDTLQQGADPSTGGALRRTATVGLSPASKLPPAVMGSTRLRQLLARDEEWRQECAECGYNLPPSSAVPPEPVRVQNSAALRSALWAVAQAASSEHGATSFVTSGEGNSLLQRLVRLATAGDCLSIRGLMITVLSLIARSERGRQALERLGWATNASEGYTAADGAWYGICFCFPLHYAHWCAIPDSPFPSVPCELVHGDEVRNLGGTEGFEPRRYHTIAQETAFDAALKHVRSLSNPVTVDGASKGLKKMRQTDQSIFHDPMLAFEMHELLNTQRFRASARKFIYDTFVDNALYTADAFAQLDQRPRGAPIGSPRRGPSPAEPVSQGSPGAATPAGSSSPAARQRRSPQPTQPPPSMPASEPLAALLRGLTDPGTQEDPKRIRELVLSALQGPESLMVNQVLYTYHWTGSDFKQPLTTQKMARLALELRKYVD